MAGQKRTLPFDLALADPLGPPGTRRRVVDRSVWDSFISTSSSSPPVRQHALEAHYSCVNALAVSPSAADGARWLASGGDDKRVLLWDTALDSETATTASEPVTAYTGASSNLFTIAFTCDGKKILSGGNDSVVFAHDVEYASGGSTHRDGGIRPTQVWLDHEGAVNSISPHPFNPALFISASSDGTLRQFDHRSHDSGRAVAIIADGHGMNHVQHHPLTPEVFVYAGERGNLALIDGRTGWRSSNGDDLEGVNVASRVAVHKFHTRLTRGSGPTQRYAYPTISSFIFDRTGSTLCATISGYLPTLYELSDPEPLACFASPAPATTAANGGPASSSISASSISTGANDHTSSEEESNAQKRASTSAAPPAASGSLLSFPRGYRNTTTTKHGSFGGGVDAAPGRGLYYAAGSDDFKAYVWEVPNLEHLREGRRRRVAASAAVVNLQGRDSGQGGGGGIRFLDMSTYGPTAAATYPTLVSPASSVLTGHRSVVNTALFHPTLPLLYTAGVEKIIVQHGPAATSLVDSAATSLVDSDPSSSRGDVEQEGSHASSSASHSGRWRFVPREPKPHFSHPGLDGPSDPADDPDPLPGETPQARELRLRQEDPQVLQYFDGLVEAEGEDMLWNDSDDTDDDDDDDEEDISDHEEHAAYLGRLRDILEREDTLGSNRGVLNIIYQLQGARGYDVDDFESGSAEEDEGDADEEEEEEHAMDDSDGGNIED